MYSGKVVVLGQKWLYSDRSGCNFGKVLFIRAKVVVIGQNWIYSGKCGSSRAKVVVFGQGGLYLGKSV